VSRRPAAVVSSLAAALAACRPAPQPAAPVLPAQPAPRVTIESPSGRATAVEVELARTPAEQERGLMFRERLAPASGMLFVFSDDLDRVFWMKNTLIPLDMIFIDARGAVVGVVERAEPLTLAARGVGAPSRYVLEVPGGFCAEHGVRAGDRVRLEGL
jgi:uncharacterized membrane protein (UPF0127 family)